MKPRPAAKDAVVGRGLLSLRVLALLGTALFFVFMVLTSTGGENSLGLAIRDAALYGLVTAVFVLIGTTSVRVSTADTARLVGVFVSTDIPLASIAKVSGDNGLEVATVDGKTYTHFGYGSSLLGGMTGNRQATAVARRIRDAVQATNPGGTAAAPRAVAKRPRPGLAMLVVLPIVYVVLAAVVHALTHR